MHDPLTVAFDVKIPLPWKVPSLYAKMGSPKHAGEKEWAKYHFLTIWHEDPCKGPGGDDSCGWFMRSWHGDKEVLAKIEKAFEFDWDRVFDSDSGKSYACGLFLPSGKPHLSVTGIAINLFFMAANEHFRSTGHTNWKRSKRWMRKHLFDIMLFAENTTDSLHDGFTLKFGNDASLEERIKGAASCIYAWILRTERPWYRHPRFHVKHWKIQWHFGQRLWRWLKRRCKVCGKRIPMNDHGVVADGWSDNSPLTCGKCSCASVAQCEAKG